MADYSELLQDPDFRALVSGLAAAGSPPPSPPPAQAAVQGTEPLPVNADAPDAPPVSAPPAAAPPTTQQPTTQQPTTQPTQAPVEEQPPPAASGPIDMRVLPPVEKIRGTLPEQAQQLQDETVAEAGEAAESHLREGDAKAEAASRAAKIYRDAASLANRYAIAAEQNYNTHQDRAAHYRRMVDEDFERLQKEPVRPGKLKSVFNVITGIIGAAAGGSQGDAINMLRQHVNRSAELDAQERGEAERRIGVAGKIHDDIVRDSANEFDASAKLVAGQWLVASRQLEQVANESNVPLFREQALRLAIDARQQARNILQHNVQAQMAQQLEQAKQVAASMQTDWSKLSQRELEALAQQGLLPIEVAKGLAETQKAQREALGDKPKVPRVRGRRVVDPELFADVSPADLAAFKKTDAKMEALETVLDKLDAKLAMHGTEAFGGEKPGMQALAGAAVGTIKDVKGLGALDKGLLEYAETLLGDPASWTESGASVRARIAATRQSLREELEALADTYGINRKPKRVDQQAEAFGATSTDTPVAEAPAGPPVAGR